MARFNHHQVEVRVSAVGLTLGESHLSDLDCLTCGERLTIHQPENGFPERMLGTCEACHTWYLWDFYGDLNHAVMVALPDRGFFKNALTAGG